MVTYFKKEQGDGEKADDNERRIYLTQMIINTPRSEMFFPVHTHFTFQATAGGPGKDLDTIGLYCRINTSRPQYQ
jgi:hypothetical protein